MKDKSSKNRQKSQKNSNSNASQTNAKVNQSNKNVNEPATTVKSGKQQQQQQNNSIITTTNASTKPETINATNCDSGECFGSSQNGNVIASTETMQDCTLTAPSSDETDRSTTVDSNCNTIRIDSKPNRDKSDVDSTSNIVTTEPPSQAEPVDNSNISTSTQNRNAQSNEMPTARSNFRNQIMEQMKNASVDVPDSSSKPITVQKQPSLTYSDGQWSPANSDGKKFYNRDQLIMLRNQPASLSEPNFPGGLSAIVKTNNNHSNMSTGGGNDLMPKFAGQTNFSKSGSHQRHNYSKRSSQTSMQQNAQNNGNANKGSKSDMIYMKISVREEVKLNEAEHAWLPSFRRAESEAEPTDGSEKLSSNELLFKRVRGVLNKLTPERFDTLFEEISSFNIETSERLHGVISLVFEKAIDEPHFSVAYARLCSKLSESLAASESDSKPLFKKTLITKCQNEFEKHVVNEQILADKLAPFLAKVNETDDPDKKLEHSENLKEEERKLRLRSVGTVRFIGELYKIGMLTSKIMIGCIRTLIDKDSEDKLECSCKLLATIGAKLEDAVQRVQELKVELNEAFKLMQSIVDRKIPNIRISSRVRFMLQDVLDLRKRRWVPRSTDAGNPKTMGQIQKEAEAEQQNIILLNYNTRRDDRGRNDNRSNGGYQKSNRQSNEDGWLPGAKSRSTTLFDTSKFKNNKTSIDDSTVFGSAALFKWGQNANNNATPSAAAPPLANSFAALDSARGLSNSIENPPRSNRNGRDNYHSKGSMERYQHSDRRNSRSGSQHRSRENSLARNFPQRSNIPPFSRSSQSMNAISTSQQSLPITRADPTATVNLNPVEPSSADVEKMQKLVRELLENHHIGEVSLANCHVDVDKTRMEHRWVVVRELLNVAVEVQRLKTIDRIFAGKSLNQWIKMKLITRSDILTGMKSFLEPVEDISLDIPHIWLYIAEIIAPVIENENLKLIQLKTLCPDHVHRILEELLPYQQATYGPTYVNNLLKSNELNTLVTKPEQISDKLKNFVATIATLPAESAVINNQKSGLGKASSETINMDDIQRHIKKLLLDNVKLDVIYDYISANVTEIDNNFIRALTTAVVDSSLDNRFKMNDKQFLQRIPLLERYIDGNNQLQLQALIAIQILIHRLEHPQGLMQSIFSNLVTEKIISTDSIMNWKNRTDVMDGKGVAVTSLRNFFELLENSDGSSEDEDN
ncbi:hypothetical protein HA402_015198 [Bradysia odoriphaga]|nr:hypothetical protein HA402_015198 [Bradysia odoriphaga]